MRPVRRHGLGRWTEVPNDINFGQKVIAELKMSDKFMNFLAKLESVAPQKDRAVINQVRGLYAKHTAQMEGADQSIKKNAVSGIDN